MTTSQTYDSYYPVGCFHYDYCRKSYILQMYGMHPNRLIEVKESAVQQHGGSVLEAAREHGTVLATLP